MCSRILSGRAICQSISHRPAMCQSVSRWPVTKKARVTFQATRCWICGEQIDTGTDITPCISSFHSQYPQSVSTASIHSQYPQAVSTVSIHSQYPQPVSTASIHSQYPQPVSTVSIHSQYPQSVSTVSIHSQYPQSPTPCSYRKLLSPKTAQPLVTEVTRRRHDAHHYTAVSNFP